MKKKKKQHKMQRSSSLAKNTKYTTPNVMFIHHLIISYQTPNITPQKSNITPDKNSMSALPFTMQTNKPKHENTIQNEEEEKITLLRGEQFNRNQFACV